MLDDLARELDVSSSTVRRDLDTLEEQGAVERTRAGAIFRGEPKSTSTQTSIELEQRMGEHVEQKKAIGKYAASLIEPNMTILLDGGSTVVYAARQIEARPLQIVTSSLSIANHFADDDDVELLDRRYGDRELLRRIVGYFRPYGRQMLLVALMIFFALYLM